MSQGNEFVPLLCRICSSVKNKIISELQRIYYKTTKIGYFSPAFFPYSKISGITKRRNEMSVETSNQKENTSSQSGKSIAEGKRKEESEGLALSLQDVFSDSGSATGSSQKTSSPSDTERRKGAQL